MERPCLTCGAPSTGTRCPLHTKQREAARAQRKSSLYWDAEYIRNRKAILDGNPQCHWGCGQLATTADHVIPLARGGSHDITNLVPACLPCNSSRGGKQRLQ